MCAEAAIVNTPMSRPRFPPEILDHIVENLHNDPGALTQCCLVSKSWVPRTRRHLFAHIEFWSNRLKMWEKTFPDPTNSPAYYTRTLAIDLDGEDAEDCNWIRGFSRVEELSLTATHTVSTSFTPFYHLSPSLKSLLVCFDFVHPQFFNFIHSLPFLQDLTLDGSEIADLDDEFDGPQDTVLPLTSPPFTGSLSVFMEEEIASTARRLLDLPNGLRFREIRLTTYEEEDVYSIVELITACSETLECLYITFVLSSKPDSPYSLQSLELPSTVGSTSSPLIDLSEATKLKEVS